MRPAFLPAFLKILLRAALLVAIVASAALFVDYQQALGPSFCGVASGCAKVRGSAFAHPFGPNMPGMPTYGLGGFFGLFLLTAWASTKRHYRWLALFCCGAALGGLGLVYIMVFQIKAVCPWCMGVDSGALVSAAVALILMRTEPEPEPEPVLHRVLWTALGVGAAVITMVWGRSGPAYKPPPADVAALQVPGTVTMVVFTDFECPYCRAFHPLVEELLDKNSDQVRVKLVMVPLPIHLGADSEARVYLCTDEARQRAVAHALYTLPYDDMTNETAQQAATAMGLSLEGYVEKINAEDKTAISEFTTRLTATVRAKAIEAAEKEGVDKAKLQSCIDDKATVSELERQSGIFERAGLEGLPSTYVSNFLVEGADEVTLRMALKSALAGGGRPVRWMFAVIVGLFLMVTALTAGTARRPAAAAPAAAGPADGKQDSPDAAVADKAARPGGKKARASLRPKAAVAKDEAAADEAAADKRAPAELGADDHDADPKA